MKMYRVIKVTITNGLMVKESTTGTGIIDIPNQDLLLAGIVVKMAMYKEFAGMIV